MNEWIYDAAPSPGSLSQHHSPSPSGTKPYVVAGQAAIQVKDCNSLKVRCGLTSCLPHGPANSTP